MRVEIHVLQPLRAEMRIELGRCHIRVPEHLLERAQVAAAREQVGRERVAQRVRAHLAVEAGRLRVPLDDLVEALAREAAAALVDEQARLRAPAYERRAPPRGGGLDRAPRRRAPT